MLTASFISACGGGISEEELDKVSKDLTETRDNIATLESNRNRLTDDLAEAQQQIKALQGDQDKLTEDSAVAQQQIKALEGDQDKLTEDSAVAQRQITALENDRDKLIKDLAEAKLQLATLENETENLSEALTEASDPEIQNKDLPASVDSVEIERLVSSFKVFWNDDDFESIYNMLSDSVKFVIAIEDVVSLFGTFKPICGNLLDTQYSHHTYTGLEAGRDAFDLHYLARFEGRPGGNITISITSVGDTHELLNINFNCGASSR